MKIHLSFPQEAAPHPEQPSKYPKWKSQDGRIWRLEDMQLTHLRNCYKLTLKRLQECQLGVEEIAYNPFDEESEAFVAFESMESSAVSRIRELESLVEDFHAELRRRGVKP